MLLFAACGGDQDEDAAPSGIAIDLEAGASLFIADGSLPDGVEPSDITVTALPAPPPPTDGSIAPVAQYEFGPDGLELSEPALLRIPLQLDPGATLLAFLVSDEAEPERLEVTVDPETGADGENAFVELRIPHFSQLWVYKTRPQGSVEILEPAGDEFFVGQPFTVELRVRRQQEDEYTYWTNGYRYRVHAPGLAWSMTGTFRTEGPLDPAEVVNPREESTERASWIAVEQSFTCQQTGNFVIRYESVVSRNATLHALPSGGPPIPVPNTFTGRLDDHSMDGSAIGEFVGRCIGSGSTDPTPDPTTELTPGPTTDPTSEPTTEPTAEPTPEPELSGTSTGVDHPPFVGDRTSDGYSIVIACGKISGVPAGTTVTVAVEGAGASGSFEAKTDASGAFSILVGIFSYAPIEWSIEQIRTPDGELIPGITGGHQTTVGDAESECGG